MSVHQNVIARSNLNNSQKQKAMFALGQDFFAAGMLDRAESVFLELLDSNSQTISSASICEALRTIYEQTQEWQKAIEATQNVQKALKKDKTNKNNSLNMDSLICHYYCELADESLESGNLHAVDGFIAKAEKTYKQSTRLMSLQGNVAFHQKHYKSAIKFYLNAIRQDSRLLSMLFSKLEEAAKNCDDIPYIQKELLKAYKENQDNNVLEAILNLAQEYSTVDGVGAEIDELIGGVLNSKKLTVKAIYKASGFIKDRRGLTLASTENSDLINIHNSLANHLQGVPSYRCEHCGYKMHDYLWRCPACNHWDTVDQV